MRRPLFVLTVAAVMLTAGCGGSDGSPGESGTEGARQAPAAVAAPTNPFDGLTTAEVAAAELQLASGAGSCSTLRDWYEANPGDSNLGIAKSFYASCGTMPPPVESGELQASAVQPVAAPSCSREMQAEIVDTNFTPGDQSIHPEMRMNSYGWRVRVTNPTSGPSVGLQPRVKIRWADGRVTVTQRQSFAGDFSVPPNGSQEFSHEDEIHPSFGRAVDFSIDGFDSESC